MKLTALHEPTWRSGAAFNHLSKAIRCQLKSYTLADLVTIVANKLPISTESAMEEAEAAGAKLRKDFFNVRNLEGSHFLDIKGKQKVVTSEEFSALSYFVFLVNVYPTVVDTRIIQESLSTGFGLKLPLTMYNTTTDTVVEELRNRRIDRNGTTGLSKLVGSADLDVLASLRKVLFGGGGVETINPGLTNAVGAGTIAPASPGA